MAAFLDPVEQSGERLRLLAECDERKVLGSDVDIEIDACDECNTVVNVKRITRETKKAGGGFVGHVTPALHPQDGGSGYLAA